jgi:thiol-disulfide isomerase/thioredoxin
MPTSALGAEPHRIVLLGARWCAPCMAEYAHLPELVRAAAPDRIVLAWIDRPIAVPAGLQGQVDSLPRRPRALAEHELGVGFGLPAARPGAWLPAWRGPLHPTDLATWRSHCAGSAH